MAPSRTAKAKEGNNDDVPDILKLHCVAGPSKGAVFKKPGRTLTLGRTGRSKIWVKDPSVSEKHAKLEWSGSCWLLQDVGSSNGTSVNGKALEAEGVPLELKDGDVILVGEASVLHVEIVPVASEDVCVEDFLQAECARIEQRLQARLEQLASKLKDQWQLERQKLVAEAAEVA